MQVHCTGIGYTGAGEQQMDPQTSFLGLYPLNGLLKGLEFGVEGP